MKDDLYGGKIRCNLKSESAHFLSTMIAMGVLCQRYSHPEGKGLFSRVFSPRFLSRPGEKCCQVQPVKPLMNEFNEGLSAWNSSAFQSRHSSVQTHTRQQ